MGREVKRYVMGPPAICNACGKAACTLDQAWMGCYHCDGDGVFIHRSAWHITACYGCADDSPYLCAVCGGLGCIISAKEMDLDVDALYRGFLEAGRRYERDHREVPPAVAAAAVAANTWMADSDRLAIRPSAT